MGGTAELYQLLAKAAARWPVDVARRNRDLGQLVRERVEREFGKTAGSGTQTERLLRIGRAELEAMEKLCGNHFKKQYARAADIATTNQPRTLYENVLSNSGQQDIKKGRSGGIGGFFRRIFGSK